MSTEEFFHMISLLFRRLVQERAERAAGGACLWVVMLIEATPKVAPPTTANPNLADAIADYGMEAVQEHLLLK